MSFGMMEAMLSFLRRQVGLRTDATGATGSLHAKVGDVKNYLANTINPKIYNWAAKNISVLTGGGQPDSETNLISVTGAGWALGLYGITRLSQTGTITPKVYVNNSLVMDFGALQTGTAFRHGGIWRFTTSFRVTGTGSGNVPRLDVYTLIIYD